MSNPLVTLVLPIYKVEPYLNRCISSVVSQTYQNLEILLIDDGSPDKCPEMCDEWAKKDERIKVIHKQNEGLGMARNTGIDYATGEYLFFIDSDDFIAPDLVECCINTKNETNADAVVYGYSLVGENERITEEIVPKLPQKVVCGQDVKQIVIPCLAGPVLKDKKIYHIASSAWSLMYSAKIIKNSGFKFVSEREIISEDLYSNLIYYNHLDSVAAVQKALYHHCENNFTSLTRAYNPERFSRNKHFYLEAIKLCDSLGHTELTKKTLSTQLLGNTIAAIKQTVYCSLPRKERRKNLKAILCDQVTKKALDDYDFQADSNSFRKFFLSCMKKENIAMIFLLLTLKKHCKG